MRAWTCLALLALLGCKKAIDAPDAIEELVVFGFVHYDDEGYPAATVEELIPAVNGLMDQLAEGYLVDSLTEEDLAAAGVDDPDVSSILGALGAVDYRHDLDDILRTITRDDKDELYDNIPAYEVLETTDLDCFLDRTCARLEQRVYETTHVPVLGDATRTFTQQYQWVTLEDGTEMVLIRTLNPDPMEFSSALLTVHQQYALVAIWPHGDAARRSETFWVDAEFIGLEVPDNYAVKTAVSEMADQAEQVDDLLDSEG